jgi:hypothetical protein
MMSGPNFKVPILVSEKRSAKIREEEVPECQDPVATLVSPYGWKLHMVANSGSFMIRGQYVLTL